MKRFTWRQRARIWLISWAGRLLVGLIGRTLRFRVEGWENYEPELQSSRVEGAGRRPVILSFWHSQIFVATYFWRHRGIVVITSEHFDGEYIARIIESFGYGTARGSSTRGAVRALLGLKRRLGEGRDVAFTIDGPKGPREKVKSGPLWLSKKAGAPVVCFHIEPMRFWEFDTWDRMRVPKPFSKVLVKIGRPLLVPPKDDPEEWIERYQEEMDRLQRDCEEVRRTSSAGDDECGQAS